MESQCEFICYRVTGRRHKGLGRSQQSRDQHVQEGSWWRGSVLRHLLQEFKGQQRSNTQWEKKNLFVSPGYFRHCTYSFSEMFQMNDLLTICVVYFDLPEICFSIFCLRGRTPWSNCGSCQPTGASLYTRGQGWQERCSMGHRPCLTTQRTTVSIRHDNLDL